MVVGLEHVSPDIVPLQEMETSSSSLAEMDEIHELANNLLNGDLPLTEMATRPLLQHPVMMMQQSPVLNSATLQEVSQVGQPTPVSCKSVRS